MTRRALLAATCAAVAVLPVSPAVAQLSPSTLPDGSLSTLSEAGGQLFWVTPSAGAKISLYTRPAAGGGVRLLGTVPGGTLRTDPDFADVAFDGTNYAVVLGGEEIIASTIPDDDCDGVCEADYLHQEEVIAGTLAGAPKVLTNCTLNGSEDDAPRPAVAIAAGRTFFAGLHCGAPAGMTTLDTAGAVTSFDPNGGLPLQGAGNWITYAGKGATKVTDLTGSGSYSVPVAIPPNTSDPLLQSLLLQADGSIVLSGGFFRTGGTTPPVTVRTKWRYSAPETLFAGDRLFFGYLAGELSQLSLTSGQGPRAFVTPGLASKRALSLTGSMLNVAGYACTGAVSLRTLDIGVPGAAGAVDGCPLEVTTGTLRLTKKRTITAAVRCVNGCTGVLTLEIGNLELPAKVRSPVGGGKATVRYTLTRKQAKAAGKSATFLTDGRWLTVSNRAHRLKKPR
jgi:hypothetical protein